MTSKINSNKHNSFKWPMIPVGKAVDLTIEIDTDDEYNLSGLRLARSNSALVNRMIEERQLQGMKVTHWDDSHIQGTVNITDDSTWMMTSIPYEKGWTVKVDGQSRWNG